MKRFIDDDTIGIDYRAMTGGTAAGSSVDPLTKMPGGRKVVAEITTGRIRIHLRPDHRIRLPSYLASRTEGKRSVAIHFAAGGSGAIPAGIELARPGGQIGEKHLGIRCVINMIRIIKMSYLNMTHVAAI